MNRRLVLLSISLLASGCTVGPNYKRPIVAVPGSYRGMIPEQTTQTEVVSLGDQKWWEVFQDEQLRALIRTALQQNYDLRIAASRVIEAQAQVERISRATGVSVSVSPGRSTSFPHALHGRRYGLPGGLDERN